MKQNSSRPQGQPGPPSARQMNRESSRPQGQPGPPSARHQFNHQVPTVIHDPEEKMMVLARWTHRALKNPARFWGTIGVSVAGILGLVLLGNLVLTGSSGSGEVWAKLEAAKKPSDRLKIAEDYPNSPASSWARLQAATGYYNEGFADLPHNRDVALPTLKKALDLFDRAEKEVPQDSPQARAAALGKARTLEARNELSKAIQQYQLVEKTWPGSPQAAQAKQLAAALEEPEAAAFYKELYAFSPAKVTLPPLGSENLEMPLVPAPGTSSSLGGAAKAGSFPSKAGSFPMMPLLPPPRPVPVTQGEKAPAKSTGDAGSTKSAASSQPVSRLPESPFAPAKGEKPKL